MPDPVTLDNVLQSPHVWRMGDLQRRARPAHPTGFNELDALLPDAGWPAQGLIDVHCDELGIGEMSLLLAAQRAARTDRSIAWLNPPALPYAPALLESGIDPARVLVVQPDSAADTLWAAEQILRSGAVATLFVWLRQPAEYSQLRRLHLAAEAGQVAGFVFRSTAFMQQPSPAPLRISLAAHEGRTCCTVFKARSLITACSTSIAALASLQQPAGPVPAQLLFSSHSVPHHRVPSGSVPQSSKAAPIRTTVQPAAFKRGGSFFSSSRHSHLA